VELQFVLPSWFTTSSLGGGLAFASQAFALSNFPGSSSLLSVFDQYRFEQIEVWVENTSPNSVAQFPNVVTAVDLDDANLPTSLSQIEDHMGALFTLGPAGHYHRFKPHLAVAAYSGAFTSYANMPSQWIDSASSNVAHFGLKAGSSTNATTAYQYSLTARAVVSFRAPTIN